MQLLTIVFKLKIIVYIKANKKIEKLFNLFQDVFNFGDT